MSVWREGYQRDTLAQQHILQTFLLTGGYAQEAKRLSEAKVGVPDVVKEYIVPLVGLQAYPLQAMHAVQLGFCFVTFFERMAQRAYNQGAFPIVTNIQVTKALEDLQQTVQYPNAETLIAIQTSHLTALLSELKKELPETKNPIEHPLRWIQFGAYAAQVLLDKTEAFPVH